MFVLDASVKLGGYPWLLPRGFGPRVDGLLIAILLLLSIFETSLNPLYSTFLWR